MDEEVPSIFELNWLDLKLYQHPPCMFILWYIGCVVNVFWDDIKDFVDGITGGGGGGSSPPPPEEEAA